MFRYGLYILTQAILNQLSSKQAYAFSKFVADIHRSYSHEDRLSVKDNLKSIMDSNEDVYSGMKNVFRNFGCYLTEFLRMKKYFNDDYIKKNIKVENIEYYDEALKRGKGAIALSAHLGNWEMGTALISHLGYPMNVIALPHAHDKVNCFFNEQRRIQGVNVIQTNESIKKCFDVLKNNEVIAIAADRDFTASGEVVDFLGRDCKMPKGAAIFAAKLGTAIIPTFLLRNAPDDFTLVVREPIYPPDNIRPEDRQTVIIDLIQKCSNVLAEEIKKRPTQWEIFRRYWTL